MTSSTAGVVWPPMEANEVAINQYLKKSESMEFVVWKVRSFRDAKVWDFDEQLSTIMPPHYALLLCFSNYKKVEELMKPLYDKLKTEGCEKSAELPFFMKQKISNACGTFALFHALAHNADKIDLGQGSFSDWFKKAKSLSVEERSESLANDTQLTADHKECAGNGQSQIPEQGVENHFICYTNVGGRLFETDSRMCCPRDCGPTSDDSLLQDTGKICKELFAKMDDGNFSAIALVTENGNES